MTFKLPDEQGEEEDLFKLFAKVQGPCRDGGHVFLYSGTSTCPGQGPPDTCPCVCGAYTYGDLKKRIEDGAYAPTG